MAGPDPIFLEVDYAERRRRRREERYGRRRKERGEESDDEEVPRDLWVLPSDGEDLTDFKGRDGK